MEFRLDARLSVSYARLSRKHDAGTMTNFHLFCYSCYHQHRAFILVQAVPSQFVNNFALLSGVLCYNRLQIRFFA